MHFDKEGDRKELQEAARQALARTARAMACLSGVFSLKDIEPVMARLDPAARREVLASLQQNRQMHLEPQTLEIPGDGECCGSSRTHVGVDLDPVGSC